MTRHGPTRQAGFRALPAMALLALIVGAANVAILAIGRYPAADRSSSTRTRLASRQSARRCWCWLSWRSERDGNE